MHFYDILDNFFPNFYKTFATASIYSSLQLWTPRKNHCCVWSRSDFGIIFGIIFASWMDNRMMHSLENLSKVNKNLLKKPQNYREIVEILREPKGSSVLDTSVGTWRF